ncbi:hypothetical protein H6G00_00440 [Leptolyngbya sp. FACHB-541]|uniref:hypothetical protein n=1 Tax=Leptolyngbya sp. FACHB-541 TaxID=2692810 RepID=UPI0016871BC4|nr:hypothetical protein [Leptolyngbya sp. FACHB-541]MBD1995096.1 hypothetical protein [Leptolyngbya sp. FACHB-541]
MESEQQDKLLGQISPLDDNEWLLRLHFSPEHIQDGEFVPTAISLSDLKERGYSLDREAFVERHLIVDRAEAQSMRLPEKRKESYLSRFECGPVRCLKHEGETAFEVKESPRHDNPAHAHILSAQRLGDGALRKLRNYLLPYLKPPVLLDDYMQQP